MLLVVGELVARRRFVSSSAPLIASVCLSAYIRTRPLTWRAARPIVWIERRPAAQEAFLVGVEDRDERHLGQVEPFTQQVHADEHVVLAEPQLADDLDPLQRVDLRVQVARLDARFEQVVGEILRHLLRQRRHEHTLTPPPRAARISFRRSSIWFRVGRSSTSGSTRQVGRISCSATRFDRRSSQAPGVAETKTSAAPSPGTRRSAAAGCRARSAAGSRSRPVSACASGRLRTCRRSAAPSDATRR